VKIFSHKGVPVRLHYSFLILGAAWFIYEGITGGLNSAVSIGIGAIALFGSVLLHEMGHAAMAKSFGIPTRHITLYPFGGIAAIEKEPKMGSEEFFIAIAGPAVNFIIAGLLIPIFLLGYQFIYWAIMINLVMGIFNLIPAYPMDGGRILRSILSSKMRKTKATKISLNVSLIFSSAFVIFGILYNWIGLVLVGIFLWYAINVEKRRLLL